ncbi:glycoside hydrolase family 3 C-terminal domain-containing protein [Streptomyces sp. SP18BB07]|uniref:glycoside hydrolase family 3 C-terminal domain-containing protein n=1 Tax=Streptomyces sp. SP18BB07 TaxID=3002522 RepID=UPI003FCC8880
MQGKYSTLPASELGEDAVIQAFNPGMQGGRAIAELLLGRIEPSGRLPLSVPRPAGQLPLYRSQVRGLHGPLRRGPRLRAGALLGTDSPESRHVTDTHRLPSLDDDDGWQSCKCRLTAVRRHLHDG